jgi:hypothetical protein
MRAYLLEAPEKHNTKILFIFGREARAPSPLAQVSDPPLTSTPHQSLSYVLLVLTTKY